jgi:ABC-type spermidine/putrescine transport system permease subunit I
VYVWFGLLNTVGAVIAAVPVAILLRRLIDRNRVRAAFLVGAPTALVMIGSVIAHYSPLSRASAFIAIALFLAMLLAVPFLVWSMRALPSNNRFERSRGPASSASEGGDR